MIIRKADPIHQPCDECDVYDEVKLTTKTWFEWLVGEDHLFSISNTNFNYI